MPKPILAIDAGIKKTDSSVFEPKRKVLSPEDYLRRFAELNSRYSDMTIRPAGLAKVDEHGNPIRVLNGSVFFRHRYEEMPTVQQEPTDTCNLQ